jgi:hypothetical protein
VVAGVAHISHKRTGSLDGSQMGITGHDNTRWGIPGGPYILPVYTNTHNRSWKVVIS